MNSQPDSSLTDTGSSVTNSWTGKRIVKIMAPNGWEPQFNDWVADFCIANKLTFVDRADVFKPKEGNLTVVFDALPFVKNVLPKDQYAWFAHRGMEDLPFTEVLPVPVELL